MKYAFIAIIIVAIGFAGFMVFSSVKPSDSSSGGVVKVTASITNRSYDPAEVNIPLGSTVELTVTNNDDEQHGLGISDFGVNDFVAPLQTKTVRFVASKKGQSTTFCSVDHPEKLIINVT